ncbi:MAG: ExbD/TolR family protein [Rhodocyclaceae bacterium]|nr:ExbD/TolR family protein [Rhodocyclaceae bacterium]MDP2194805.1 ExbD/TolR family protein [Rhodocyclaceae bacterium]
MRSRRLKHEINVVPYIDVMLVLLVIFMATAPAIQTASIDLPSVGKASTPPVEPLEITVKADGAMEILDHVLGGKPVTIGRLELAAKLKELQAKNPAQPVLIAGDKNVRYEAVLNVMDELQRAQVAKIGLLVQHKNR